MPVKNEKKKKLWKCGRNTEDDGWEPNDDDGGEVCMNNVQQLDQIKLATGL